MITIQAEGKTKKQATRELNRRLTTSRIMGLFKDGKTHYLFRDGKHIAIAKLN